MAIWKSEGEWRYEYFSIDQSEEAIFSSGFESIIRLWRLKSKTLPPRWADFEFMDFREWWGWLSVYDSIDGQSFEFDVRLWGTKVVETTGHELTGKRLSLETLPEISDPTGVSSNSIKFARYNFDEGVIGITSEPFRADWGPNTRYNEILLPLSSDGTTNDKILFAGKITGPKI